MLRWPWPRSHRRRATPRSTTTTRATSRARDRSPGSTAAPTPGEATVSVIVRPASPRRVAANICEVSARRSADFAQFPLEVLDLVAETGGVLEAEVGGGLL